MWMDFSAIHRKREDLCRTFICTSDKFLKWSSSDYLGFRGFIIAILMLPDFCMLFLIYSSFPIPHVSEFSSLQHFPPSEPHLLLLSFSLSFTGNSCGKVSPREFSSVSSNTSV